MSRRWTKTRGSVSERAEAHRLFPVSGAERGTWLWGERGRGGETRRSAPVLGFPYILRGTSYAINPKTPPEEPCDVALLPFPPSPIRFANRVPRQFTPLLIGRLLNHQSTDSAFPSSSKQSYSLFARGQPTTKLGQGLGFPSPSLLLSPLPSLPSLLLFCHFLFLHCFSVLLLLLLLRAHVALRILSN